MIKNAIGKLAVRLPPADTARYHMTAGFGLLGVNLDHVLDFGSLPLHHRDPFDRLLVAQARVEGLTVITSDPLVRRYPVPTLW